MIFVGVDLAWGTKAVTGLAAVDDAGRLVDVAAASTDDEILTWITRVAPQECVVAFDAPLIVKNDTGMRNCERLVGRHFTRFGFSCHASNRQNPAFADGGRAARLAAQLGLDVSPDSRADRRAIEVYPHTAIVQLFGLGASIRYKHKSGRDLDLLRQELTRLFLHVEQLGAAEPPLRAEVHPRWQEIRAAVASAQRKTELKVVEDEVDAVLCAYVAMLSQLQPHRVRVLGGVDGYIVTPVDDAMARAIDEDTRPLEQPRPRRKPASSPGLHTRLSLAGHEDGTAPLARLGTDADGIVSLLSSVRQHQQEGRRAPHKPLLMLLSLGRLLATGSSAVPWSLAEDRLADLIAEFGPPSRTGRTQSAAYPFTRLRSDGIWRLDHDVPMDRVTPLQQLEVVGSLTPELEQRLRDDPELVKRAARQLVDSQWPESVIGEVLSAVGMDPEDVLVSGRAVSAEDKRRRDPAWRHAVLQAWDRQCAFCAYDGQIGGAVVGLDAAHVRWFAFGGPDQLDNGLALCVLHHKLFDLGALGLDDELRIRVSQTYSARTTTGRAVYDLHGRKLTPRPGTAIPADVHLEWHDREVFKAAALVS